MTSVEQSSDYIETIFGEAFNWLNNVGLFDADQEPHDRFSADENDVLCYFADTLAGNDNDLGVATLLSDLEKVALQAKSENHSLPPELVRHYKRVRQFRELADAMVSFSVATNSRDPMSY